MNKDYQESSNSLEKQRVFSTLNATHGTLLNDNYHGEFDEPRMQQLWTAWKKKKQSLAQLFVHEKKYHGEFDIVWMQQIQMTWNNKEFQVPWTSCKAPCQIKYYPGEFDKARML